MTGRRPVAAAVVATVVAATAVGVVVAGGEQRSDLLAIVAHVSPSGDGDCAVHDPCSLDQAMTGEFREVWLASGRYPQAVVDVPVTIEPAPGADPVLGAVNLRAAGARLAGVRVEGTVMVSPSAVGAAVTDSVVRGSIAVQADGARLERNDIGATTDNDPVQVTASPTAVAIVGNRIHDGARGRGRGHVDCLQITSGTDITVRGNDLRQCSNSAVIVKSDLGVIRGVALVGNRLVSCRPKSDACEGSVALFVRRGDHDIADVRITGNRIDGTSSFDDIDGLVVERNDLRNLARSPSCPEHTRGNVVRERHRAACPLDPTSRYAGADDG